MFISDFSIRKPVVTIVMMLALVVFGVFALFRLEVDEFPEVNPPFITVAVAYPGASPAQVEREVIERIEDAVASIAGVDKMTLAVGRQLRPDPRRVHLREGFARWPRRTFATRSPRSATTCRPRWKSRS